MSSDEQLFDLNELLVVPEGSDAHICCIASFAFRSVFLTACYVDDGENSGLVLSLQISMTPKCVRNIPIPRKKATDLVTQMVFSPDAQWICLITVSGGLLWFALKHIFPKLYSAVESDVCPVRIRPGGSTLPVIRHSIRITGTTVAPAEDDPSVAINQWASCVRVIWWTSPTDGHFILSSTTHGVSMIDVTTGTQAAFIPVPHRPIHSIAVLPCTHRGTSSLLIQSATAMLKAPLNYGDTTAATHWGKKPFLLASLSTIDSRLHRAVVARDRTHSVLAIHDHGYHKIVLYDDMLSANPLRELALADDTPAAPIACIPFVLYTIVLIPVDGGVVLRILSHRRSTHAAATYLPGTLVMPVTPEEVAAFPQRTLLASIPQLPDTDDPSATAPRVVFCSGTAVWALTPTASTVEDVLEARINSFVTSPPTTLTEERAGAIELDMMGRATKVDVFSMFERAVADMEPSRRGFALIGRCLDPQLIDGNIGPINVFRKLIAAVLTPSVDVDELFGIASEIIGPKTDNTDMGLVLGLIGLIKAGRVDRVPAPTQPAGATRTPPQDVVQDGAAFDLTPPEAAVYPILSRVASPALIQLLVTIGRAHLAAAVTRSAPRPLLDGIAAVGCPTIRRVLPTFDHSAALAHLVAAPCRTLLLSLPPDVILRALVSIPHGVALAANPGLLLGILPTLESTDLRLVCDLLQPPNMPALLDVFGQAVVWAVYRTRPTLKEDNDAVTVNEAPAALTPTPLTPHWTRVADEDVPAAAAHEIASIFNLAATANPRRTILFIGRLCRKLGLPELERWAATAARDHRWAMSIAGRTTHTADALFAATVDICHSVCIGGQEVEAVLASFLKSQAEAPEEEVAQVERAIMTMKGTDMFAALANVVYGRKLAGPLTPPLLMELLKSRVGKG